MYVKYKLAEQHKDHASMPRWDDSDPHERLSMGKSFGLSDNDVKNFNEKTTPKKRRTGAGSTLDGLMGENA